MAIGAGSLIEIAVVGSAFDQVCMNTWNYVVGTFPSTPSAGAVAEAWWQNVKSAYRGFATTEYSSMFQEVRVREMDDPLGDYGVYAIPSGETAGTRSASTNPAVAPFIAVGVRLTVGTRTTRPGQKRLIGLGEGDISGATVGAGAVSAAGTLADACIGTLTLGAPAALTVLDTVIVRTDPITGLPTAFQEVIGYVINPNVTTQNTRKIGRGI